MYNEDITYVFSFLFKNFMPSFMLIVMYDFILIDCILLIFLYLFKKSSMVSLTMFELCVYCKQINKQDLQHNYYVCNLYMKGLLRFLGAPFRLSEISEFMH